MSRLVILLVTLPFVWSAATTTIINVAVVVSDISDPTLNPILSTSYLSTTPVAGTGIVDLSQAIGGRAHGSYIGALQDQGGVQIGVNGDTYIMPKITVFNVGRNATTRPANEKKLATDIAYGVKYGNFSLVFPNPQSGYLPFFEACESSKNCIAMGTTLADRTLYECRANPKLPQDCINRGRKEGQRRYQYAFCSNPSVEFLSTDALYVFRAAGARTIAILASNTSYASLVPGILSNAATIGFTVVGTPTAWSPLPVTKESVIPALERIRASEIQVDIIIFAATSADDAAIKFAAEWMHSEGWQPNAIFTMGGINADITNPLYIDWVNTSPWNQLLSGKDYTMLSSPGSRPPFSTPFDYYNKTLTRFPELSGAYLPLAILWNQAWTIYQRMLEIANVPNPTPDQLVTASQQIYGPSINGVMKLDVWGVQAGWPRSVYQVDEYKHFNYFAPPSLPRTAPFRYPMRSPDELSSIIRYELNNFAVLSAFMFAAGAFISLIGLEPSFAPENRGSGAVLWASASGAVLGLTSWAGIVSMVLALSPINIYQDYRLMSYDSVYVYVAIPLSCLGMSGVFVLALYCLRNRVTRVFSGTDSDKLEVKDQSTEVSGGNKTASVPTILHPHHGTTSQPSSQQQRVVNRSGSYAIDIIGQSPTTKIGSLSNTSMHGITKPRSLRCTRILILLSVLFIGVCAASIFIGTLLIVWSGIYVSASMTLDLDMLSGVILTNWTGMYISLWSYFRLLGAKRMLCFVCMAVTETVSSIWFLYCTRLTRLVADKDVSGLGSSASDILYVTVSISAVVVLVLFVLLILASRSSRNMLDGILSQKKEMIHKFQTAFRLQHLTLAHAYREMELMQTAILTPDHFTAHNDVIQAFIAAKRIYGSNLVDLLKNGDVKKEVRKNNRTLAESDILLPGSTATGIVATSKNLTIEKTRNILRDPYTLGLLYNVAIKRQTPENIMFLIAAQHYKQLTVSMTRYLYTHWICDTFIRPSANLKINISDAATNAILRPVGKQLLSPDDGKEGSKATHVSTSSMSDIPELPATLFVDAQREIVRLIATNEFTTLESSAQLKVYTEATEGILTTENGYDTYQLLSANPIIRSLLSLLSLNPLVPPTLGISISE